MWTKRVILTLLCQSVLTAKLEETVAIHSKGSNIRLTCYRENPQDKLLWTTSKGTILFNDDVRYSKAEQYSNFEVEILEDRSTLIIRSADLDDEGEYLCSDSMGKDMVNVSIEVSPNLEMKVNGIIEPLVPSLKSNISITCRATGAKPEVSIRVNPGESGWLMPTISETSPSGLLWDTIATFNILLPSDTTDTSVTCQTFGQISVENITVTEYLSSPACILQHNTLEISCNCTSNPSVDKYIFAIEGETNVTGSTKGTLSVANIMGSEVICYGLSTVGVGKSNAIAVPPKEERKSPTVFFIIVMVALIVSFALVASFVIWRAYTRRKRRDFQVESSKGDNENTERMDTPTCTSDRGKNESSHGNQKNTSEGDENKLPNDAEACNSGDDIETPLLDSQTGEDQNKLDNNAQTCTSDKGNNGSSNSNQKNTSASEVTEENIARYDRTQGHDKKSATEEFSKSGGVQQRVAVLGEGKMTLRESDDTAANNNDAGHKYHSKQPKGL